MTHFYPTPEFLAAVEEHRQGRPVIDVGAGEGELTRALMQRKVPVVAVDIFPRFQPTIPLPIHRVGLARNLPALLVVARPDHGGWVREIPGFIHRSTLKTPKPEVMEQDSRLSQRWGNRPLRLQERMGGH